jgi:hypothetical protein
LELLSEGDAQMIRRGGRNVWRCCKSAYKILSRQKARFKRLSKHLADDAVKKQIKLNQNKSSIMIELFEKPESLELPDRQQVLEAFISRLPADDPARPRFKKMLECIERGEKLPNGDGV